MLDAGVRGDFTPGLILCRFFGCQEFSSRVLTMPNTRCAKRRRGVLDNRAAELKAEGLTPRDHRKYLTQVTQDLVKVVTVWVRRVLGQWQVFRNNNCGARCSQWLKRKIHDSDSGVFCRIKAMRNLLARSVLRTFVFEVWRNESSLNISFFQC